MRDGLCVREYLINLRDARIRGKRISHDIITFG